MGTVPRAGRERAYQRFRTLRKQYGRYQGPGEGQPPGPLSTVCLPHTKGTTPDKDITPTESELAGSERGESGPKEGEVQQEEGDDPGSFTKMRFRDTDTESEDTTPGRESWRSARGRETVLLTTPWTRGQGKRRMDRGGGAAKRARTAGMSWRSPGLSVPRRWPAGCPTHDAPAPSSTAELALAGAHVSDSRVRPRISGDYPSLHYLTGGRLILGRPVRMGADGTRAGH